jgi:hypothetical protein
LSARIARNGRRCGGPISIFIAQEWSDEVADASFARIFDPLEPVHALVADRGRELIGLAHYLFQRSTWFINSQCYLQDLYVSEATRSGGVGAR